ncbi:MAG: hypothetical protein ABI970_22230 [Chloroflexota bacterium]|nr:hypothetical protein [Anaerolineae bacterium]
MEDSIRVPYSGTGNVPQAISLMPRLSLTLHLDDKHVDVNGIIDSGASVNVLPYSVGVTLGANLE